MKKYQLHTKTEDNLNRFPALCKRLEGAERTPVMPGVPRVLCLGADLEKAVPRRLVRRGRGDGPPAARIGAWKSSDSAS